MPRNASGTYTLPSGNPVSSGTLIDATWANNTLNDIANEVTDSLSRSGEGGMLAPFRLNDGVQATPGLAFTNEPSTGMYRAGTNEAWLVAGGTQVLQFTTTGAMTRYAPGAVTTPSITAMGDTNTGIFFPAADTIAFTEGGTESLRINSSGNMGLGTTSPTNTAGFSRQLQIEGTTAALTLSGTTGTGKYTLGVPGANAVGLWDNTASAYRWYVDSSGNLGIGTASPTQRLHVNGSTIVPIANSYFTFDVRFGIGTPDSDGLQIFAGDYTRFGNRSAGGVFTERMRLDTSGNLGIGTASPGSLLDVVGTATGSGIAASVRNNATTGNSLSAFRLFAHDGSTVANSGTVFLSANSWTYQQIGANQLNVYGTKAGGIRLATANSGPIIFAPTTGADADFAVESMRLTPSGNLGIGTASPATKLEVADATPLIRSNASTTTVLHGLEFSNGANLDAFIKVQSNTAELRLSSGRSAAWGGFMSFYTDTVERARITSTGNLGIGTASPGERLDVRGGGLGVGNGTIKTVVSYTTEGLVGTVSNHALLLYSNNAERARITSGGDLLVGVTTGSYHILRKAVTNDGGNTTVEFQSTGGSTSQIWYGVSGFNANAANAATKVGRDATTLRSINAGGTVNASGADYAEYMTKAGDFALAKGDVCGINADGKLTNVFANAISFVVKSTDPSYVGGDSWGAKFKDNPEGLEAARQKVDRIAFAGQVPVNVLGATPGQYIVPINNNGAIKGVAVSNPTFEQYQSAVGKVIAVQDDGRALIIVKVA